MALIRRAHPLPLRVTLTPEEQKERVRSLMRKLRASWRDPGPRHYPAYREGMTTKQYVQYYLIGNQTGAAPFAPSEINCKG